MKYMYQAPLLGKSWAWRLSTSTPLQQTTNSNFASFSKIAKKAWCFISIASQQTILTKYHTSFVFFLFFFCFGGGGWGLGKLFQNVPSAAVVIGALGAKVLFPLNEEENNYPFHKLQSFQLLKHIQKLRLKMSSVQVACCIYLLTLLTNVLSCQPRVTVSSCYYQGLIIDRPLVYLS